MKGHTPGKERTDTPPEQRENVNPSQDIKKPERREPSKSISYSYNESFSSSEDTTEEPDLESLASN